MDFRIIDLLYFLGYCCFRGNGLFSKFIQDYGRFNPPPPPPPHIFSHLSSTVMQLLSSFCILCKPSVINTNTYIDQWTEMRDGNDEIRALIIPIMHHNFIQSSFQGLGTSQEDLVGSLKRRREIWGVATCGWRQSMRECSYTNSCSNWTNN